MTERKCTSYVVIDYDDYVPCRCPQCKGFLPRDFPTDGQFLCRKCGAVLEVLPEEDEEFDEEEWGGKICLVPDYAVNISTELPPKPKREIRKKTNRWALGAGFSRRVWRYRNEEFIMIDGERIELDDPRIVNVIEDDGR